MKHKKLKVLHLLHEYTETNKIYWKLDRSGSILNLNCESEKYRFGICSMNEQHDDVVININSKIGDQSFSIFSLKEPVELQEIITNIVKKAEKQATSQSLDDLLGDLNDLLI